MIRKFKRLPYLSVKLDLKTFARVEFKAVRWWMEDC